MSELNEKLVLEWLSSEGVHWRHAVKEASRVLLADYFNHPKYRRIVPVELHRLALTLNSKIKVISGMNSKAAILPTGSGFQICVSAELPRPRFRASVAHELAHTLFFTKPNGTEPERLIRHQAREEHFCFDVARHVLAPVEHLTFLGILTDTDPRSIFKKLNSYLYISRPWAARIMLADYELVTGIAGRWIKSKQGKWSYKKQGACASPSLSKDDRTELREVAKQYLEKWDENQFEDMHFVNVVEQSDNAVFLIVSMSKLKLFV